MKRLCTLLLARFRKLEKLLLLVFGEVQYGCRPNLFGLRGLEGTMVLNFRPGTCRLGIDRLDFGQEGADVL